MSAEWEHLRNELRRLHEAVEKPSKGILHRHARLKGLHAGESTLIGVPSGSGRLAWATVEAFVAACLEWARQKTIPVPTELADKSHYRRLFDEASSGQRNVRPPTPQAALTLVGVLPGLADCFQPRALVDELAQAIDDGGTAVLTGTTSAVTRLLSGMGGVGKTQLAVHLATHLYDTGRLDLLVWISAASRQAITAGYAHAAVDLALPGADGTDTEQDAARFHAWLSTTDRRWLVVLDDLNTAADLKGLWPPNRPAGRTVVTTRLRGSALTGPGRHLVPVHVFTPAEAGAYLQNRLADHPHLADNIDGLAAALFHLPLALAHATAYMIDEDVPCTEYQRRLAEQGRRLDDLAPPADELPDDYTRTVAATVSLSVRAADQTRSAGLASPLLRLASVLNPADIPEAVFTTTAARNWLAYTANTLDTNDLDAVAVHSGLRTLHRLNLITITGATITVHGLVQRVIRDDADDRLADLAWAAADALLEAWPPTERDSALSQTLRDNTTAVYQHGGESLLDPDTHPVLYRATRSLGDGGDPARAAAAVEDLLGVLRRVLGPDHPDALSMRGNLAYWQAQAGDLAGAAAATEELLDAMRRVLGPDHPDTLDTRNNLAVWLAQAGDPAGAAAATEELLADRLRILGPDHPNTLTSRANLANWHAQAGDPVRAAAAAEELLEAMLRVLGPDHPHTFTLRGNLAIWRGELGDPAGAAIATKELLADRLRILGPNHPDTQTNRENLAYWRRQASNSNLSDDK